jgi:hypothetical protein
MHAGRVAISEANTPNYGCPLMSDETELITNKSSFSAANMMQQCAKLGPKSISTKKYNSLRSV